jgi:single-strand selective monofunctional uracil DNA glycosylase
VSGQRLWGWARRRFATPEAFFARFFVANYCPLLFLEASGRNLPLDKLGADEQRAIALHCDAALRETVLALAPRCVLGVGRFAESARRDRARRARRRRSARSPSESGEPGGESRLGERRPSARSSAAASRCRRAAGEAARSAP